MSLRSRTVAVVALAALAALTVPTLASGAVERRGEWPKVDARVTVDLSRATVSEALGALAESAGWSLVVDLPEAAARAGSLDLRVAGAAAGDVLDAVLAKGAYVAERKGDLVTIRHAEPAEPAAEAKAPDGPDAAAIEAAEDRTVMGGKLSLGAGEVARNVTVMGGTVDVYGTVLGDVSVFGGRARLHEGSRVMRDVTATGGTIDVESGARVDGKAVVLGGVVHRHPGALVGGKKGGGDLRVKLATDDAGEPRGLFRRAGDAVSGGLTRAALLFVLGTIVLSLLPARAAVLREEVVRRPWRSIALGLLGFLGAGALLAALCVTIVGIPVAILLAPVLFLAVAASLTVVLEFVGGLTVGHRTESPYARLAAGALALVVVGWLPVVGKLAVSAVVLLAAGTLVATRGAGLLRKA